jgi:hypothetical protein
MKQVQLAPSGTATCPQRFAHFLNLCFLLFKINQLKSVCNFAYHFLPDGSGSPKPSSPCGKKIVKTPGGERKGFFSDEFLMMSCKVINHRD